MFSMVFVPETEPPPNPHPSRPIVPEPAPLSLSMAAQTSRKVSAPGGSEQLFVALITPASGKTQWHS